MRRETGQRSGQRRKEVREEQEHWMMRRPRGAGQGGEGWRPRASAERRRAGLAVRAGIPASQPRDPAGQHRRPVQPTLACLRSLKAPWPASLEPPKPPNSTTPVSPFHHLSPPRPSSLATVHLLIHEALISSLFNFVLNRLTGMITTCSAVLPAPTTPVFRQQGSAGDRSAEPKSLSSCTSLSQNVTRSLESNLQI